MLKSLKNLLLRQRTISDLTTAYRESRAFLDLADSTAYAYGCVLARLERDLGPETPLSRLDRQRIETLLASQTPGAAMESIKKLRILIRLAIARGWMDRDPTSGLRRPKAGKGHHTWSDGEIALFRTHWPLGTMERLAFELLLNSGQRLGDCYLMRWSDIREDVLYVQQSKTGVSLMIPLHPDLTAALTRATADDGTILKTIRGRAFSTAPSFAMWLARTIDATQLPKRCVPHGLRKSACRRLAEAGCSASQIASISGHRTLSEVSRYVAAADQARLAKAAMARIRDCGSKATGSAIAS